ncbi:MAG: hypothetical protein HOP29_09855 [Phycisphaerales bacterium]|nr:hypothetical protein [Phycisphaerales bacterium]
MMQLIEWLTNRKRPLSQLTRSELRRKELLLEKDRSQLLNRIKKLAADKQSVFEKGAGEKTPEVRRALAQEFELKTTEQLMVSRQLNIRSKELLTVSRLRMLRENADRARQTGGTLGMVSEGDILRIGRLIESDAIKTEAYQERLDEMLGVGAEVDQGATGLSDAGQAVINIWERMDTGVIRDGAEAFDEADRRVRERQAPAEG